MAFITKIISILNVDFKEIYSNSIFLLHFHKITFFLSSSENFINRIALCYENKLIK